WEVGYAFLEQPDGLGQSPRLLEIERLQDSGERATVAMVQRIINVRDAFVNALHLIKQQPAAEVRPGVIRVGTQHLLVTRQIDFVLAGLEAEPEIGAALCLLAFQHPVGPPDECRAEREQDEQQGHQSSLTQFESPATLLLLTGLIGISLPTIAADSDSGTDHTGGDNNARRETEREPAQARAESKSAQPKQRPERNVAARRAMILPQASEHLNPEGQKEQQAD